MKHALPYVILVFIHFEEVSGERHVQPDPVRKTVQNYFLSIEAKFKINEKS